MRGTCRESSEEGKINGSARRGEGMQFIMLLSNYFLEGECGPQKLDFSNFHFQYKSAQHFQHRGVTCQPEKRKAKVRMLEDGKLRSVRVVGNDPSGFGSYRLGRCEDCRMNVRA